MIRVGTGEGGSPLIILTSVEGVAIYLDNFAIISLAKGSPTRRDRFVKAIREGGAELLFSAGNAAELVGPEGRSRDSVKSLLREFGPHWFPVELDTNKVCKREETGMRAPDSFADKEWLNTFVSVQSKSYADENKPIVPSGEFFNLDVVIDWLAPGKESLVRDNRGLDASFSRKIAEYRDAAKRDPSWVDESFPELPFRKDMPAYFVYVNLIRKLVQDRGFQPKKGDGMDFSHAVIGSAFASIVTLDKQWKDRVEQLPKPNGVARVYYAPELDLMVSDLEAACLSIQRGR